MAPELLVWEEEDIARGSHDIGTGTDESGSGTCNGIPSTILDED
jgi:hypothetical protein